MERYAQLRSKNKSCDLLRSKNKGIGPFKYRSIIRLGSVTETEIAFPRSYNKYPIIEINSVKSIQNSRNKLLMKECFKNNKILQANWYTLEDIELQLQNGDISKDIFPILAKRIFGFKGKGMVKLDNKEQLKDWLSRNNTTGYYFEEYFSGSREYRLHITEEECIMAWRKLRKKDTPDDRRWYFNSDYCNWVGEDHMLFNKPNNWNEIIEESIKALKAVGLDIGSVDLRCQNSEKSNPDFKVIEINSAPSLGEKGIEVYRETIYDLIQDKIQKI